MIELNPFLNRLLSTFGTGYGLIIAYVLGIALYFAILRYALYLERYVDKHSQEVVNKSLIVYKIGKNFNKIITLILIALEVYTVINNIYIIII
jgi:hypothetical protein